MEWQEKLKMYLQDIGLNEEGEFSVYYEMLVNNFGKELKASDIAEKVSMNRSYVYNILANLVDKGLVTIILGSSPKFYTAQNPIYYVNKQINVLESKISVLKSFQIFINEEIEPRLSNIKQLTTSPIKESFFINSIEKLSYYINQSLRTCENRIIFRISYDLFKSIEKELYHSIERLLSKGRRGSIRIIGFGVKEDKISAQYLDLITIDQKDHNDYQIVIDDNTILFNLHLTPFTADYGVGVMMKDRTIADSYTYSLISSFKQIAYESLPLSRKNDLSKVILQDKQFSSGMESLFKKNWRIFLADSSPDDNYFALIAPDVLSIQESRDAGILYHPFYNDKREQLVDMIFKENQKYVLQGALESTKRFDIDYDSETKEEIIEGFTCKTLKNRGKINAKSHIQGNSDNIDELHQNIEFVSQMVVFNYFDKAVVMVWAMIDENLVSILRELSNKLPN